MKYITATTLSFAIFAAGVPAIAADSNLTFTIKGKAGMEFRADLLPKECLKKKGKIWQQVSCPMTSVDPIVLAIGPPMVLTTDEHTFNLVEGILIYTKAVGAENYSIKKYAGVCAYYIKKTGEVITKCGPIGGSVQY